MMTVNSECLYINLGESVRPETVTYKKFSAGAIIGFKGQTIKELRETTGAKLNVFQGNIFLFMVFDTTFSFQRYVLTRQTVCVPSVVSQMLSVNVL